MPVSLLWDGGGEGSIVSKDVLRVALVSTRPFPPGSRPRAKLLAGGEAIWFKVFGSRKQPDGTFHVEGRMLDASKLLVAKVDEELSR